jgi:deazaflavin-dependent oxidoreductase (nitroreductase family)
VHRNSDHYISFMPTDLAFKVMNAFHRSLLKVTGGRAGWTASNMPVLELTTTGRKSGRPRSVMLTSPVQEGTTLVVVASRGGDDKPPAWFLNLQENPVVEVAVQGKPAQPMRARVANPQERARLWPLVIADHQNYADYQARTTREIALVLLEPAPAPREMVS